MLRAVRFEKRLGFHIEDRTAQLLEEAKPLLERVSGDRIRHELDLVLKANHSVEILARLQELNLLEKIHSSLNWDAQLITPIEKYCSHQLQTAGNCHQRQAIYLYPAF